MRARVYFDFRIRFPLGLLQRSPDFLAVFNGATIRLMAYVRDEHPAYTPNVASFLGLPG